MVNPKKRNWENPAKEMPLKTEGICPICKKHVKSLESHINSKHRLK